MSFETYVKPNYVHASFATAEEIKNGCDCINHKQSGRESGGGIVTISNGKTSYAVKGDSSTITVGGTGSKKTRNVVMPHVLSCAHAGVSMILHDPKGDIYKNTKNALMKYGYKILVLDYRDPQCGDKYNPLLYAARLYKDGFKDRAREIFMNFAGAIFASVKSEKDPFWHLTAAGYFAGLAELLCILYEPETVTIDNIYSLHLQGDMKLGGSTYMKTYFDKNPDERCWKLIYPVATAPNETRNSLNAVFTGALTKFIQNDAVVDQTSGSSFEIEDFVEEKTALFIISRDEGSVYDALITAIIDQIYSILVDTAEKNGGLLKRRVSFILDEFGNLAQLTDIERKLTLSRARGISWHIVVQSLDQLSLVYGKDKAPIIIGSCNNIVYLYSSDINLVKHISSLCGDREEEITDIKSPLCSVNMLRHFDKESGETLMLLDRMNPFITHLPDISKYCVHDSIEFKDFKVREKEELKTIDFKSIIEKRKRIDLERMMKANEEEHEKERMRYHEEKKRRLAEDPNSVVTIINNVIFGMVGGVD